MAKAAKRKYAPSASKNVKSEMHRYKRGTAKSGPGGKAGKVKVSSRTCADYFAAGAGDPRRPSEPHGPSYCSAWEAHGSDPHVGTETLSYRAISSMYPAP
jgi:Family of unknown function (DUF6496)